MVTRLAEKKRTRTPAPELTVEVAHFFPLQGEWTEEAYFELPETNEIIELSEGRLIMPTPPGELHQRGSIDLSRRMADFVDAHDLGTVRYAPLPVRLWPGKIREPDIIFVAKDHLDRIHEQYYDPPDLVVEITSPSTRRFDRGEKMDEYARAGICEYWIVDPKARTTEVFVLRGEKYALLGKFGAGDRARSEVLTGFQVDVSAVV
jgi:Uma2 family endonuclease